MTPHSQEAAHSIQYNRFATIMADNRAEASEGDQSSTTITIPADVLLTREQVEALPIGTRMYIVGCKDMVRLRGANLEDERDTRGGLTAFKIFETMTVQVTHDVAARVERSLAQDFNALILKTLEERIIII